MNEKSEKQVEMNIHERMRQRVLTRCEYQKFLSDYRRRDRGEWVWLEADEPELYMNDLKSHAFDIRDHLRSLKRDPAWVHYLPVSEAWWAYRSERLGDMAGDIYEQRMEDLAEYHKSIYWG